MFFLALRHALHNRVITLLMIAGLTFVLAFPVVVSRAARVAEEVYMSRARSTPLIVGKRASAQQLTLNTLYFDGPQPAPLTMKLVKDLQSQKAGIVVPISNRLTAAKGFPLIGTGIDYFQIRKLEFSEGDPPLLLGDCVVGDTVARKYNLKAGSSVTSDITTFLNVAHDYPFKLNVSGVLKPSDTADDRAVFVDLKTAWTIEGLGHGHDNVIENTSGALGTQTPAPEAVNAQVQAILGKGVTEFREVTPQNIRTFHFHGDENDYPITAVIIAPDSEKSATMLKGAVNAGTLGADYEAVVPEEVVSGLMRMVFNVKKIFDAYFAMTAFGVSAFLVIIVMLSLRNRREEFAVMVKMGCSRHAIFALFVYEFLILFAISAGLSLLLSEIAVALMRHYAF